MDEEVSAHQHDGDTDKHSERRELAWDAPIVVSCCSYNSHVALELLIQTQLNFAKWKLPTELFLPGDGKTWLYCQWLLVWAYSIRAPASSWRATNLSA